MWNRCSYCRYEIFILTNLELCIYVLGIIMWGNSASRVPSSQFRSIIRRWHHYSVGIRTYRILIWPTDVWLVSKAKFWIVVSLYNSTKTPSSYVRHINLRCQWGVRFVFQHKKLTALKMPSNINVSIFSSVSTKPGNFVVCFDNFDNE